MHLLKFDVKIALFIGYLTILTLSGPVYEKYLTMEPEDMGESPATDVVNEEIDGGESEVTEDGKASAYLQNKQAL